MDRASSTTCAGNSGQLSRPATRSAPDVVIIDVIPADDTGFRIGYRFIAKADVCAQAIATLGRLPGG